MAPPKSSKVDKSDGTLAWLVAFSACFIYCITAGLTRINGILFVALLDTFDISRGQAVVPFSVLTCVRCLFGPIVGILGQKYSIRTIILVGGILETISAVSCAFAPNINWITFSWGGLNGIGLALSTTLLPVIVGQYFRKHRATAVGLAYSGSSVGAVVFVMAIDESLRFYGLHGTFFIMSGMLMHVIPAALILRKPPWMKSKKHHPSLSSADERPKIFTISTDDRKDDITRSSRNVKKEFTEIKFSSIQRDLHLDKPGFPEQGNSAGGTLENLTFHGNEDLFSGVFVEAIIFMHSNSQHFDSANQLKDKMCEKILLSRKMVQNFLFKLYSYSGSQDGNNESAISGARSQTYSEITESTNIEEIVKSMLIKFEQEHIAHKFLLRLQKSNLEYFNTHVSTYEKFQSVLLEISAQVNRRKLATLNEPIPLGNINTQSSDQNKLFGFIKYIKAFVNLYSDPIYILICLCRNIYVIHNFATFTVLVDFGKDKGLQEEDGKFFITTLAATDIFGRFGLGWITDRDYIVLPKYMFIGMAIQGILTAILPWVNTKWSLLCLLALLGTIQGSLFVRHSVLVLKYMEAHEKSIAMGSVDFLSGFLGLIIPVYIGYFRDTLGSYDNMFYVSGAVFFCLGLAWIFEPQLLQWVSNRRGFTFSQTR